MKDQKQSRKSPSPTSSRRNAIIRHIYDLLLSEAGPRHWWPGDGRDEIIIGAVLTQNTAWRNVVPAIENLKRAGLCRLATLARTPPEQIARLIVPAGYFNLKARRLRSVAEFFAPKGSERFDELAQWPFARLREELLRVWGVGPETADSILLYALDRISFVVDAYTTRMMTRHGLCRNGIRYEELRAILGEAVKPNLAVYNEFHALFVWVGHHFCRSKPLCAECPLSRRDCFATQKAWLKLRSPREELLKGTVDDRHP